MGRFQTLLSISTCAATAGCRASPFWCRTAAVKAQSPDIASFVAVTPSSVTFAAGTAAGTVFSFKVGFKVGRGIQGPAK